MDKSSRLLILFYRDRISLGTAVFVAAYEGAVSDGRYIADMKRSAGAEMAADRWIG